MERFWPLVVALLVYPGLLGLVFVGNSMSAPASEFPAACPENSLNCERVSIEIDGVCPDLVSVFEEAALSLDETAEEVAPGHWVFTTQWMMFKDDVFVESSMQGDTCTIQIHSESRLGVDDLEANENRIAAIQAAL